MEQIIILNIEFQFGDVKDAIHPVILMDDANAVLVDCGYTGFLPQLEAAMEQNGLHCHDLTHVLITHQDHDHMGALYDLKQKYPHTQIIVSKIEAPFISGREKSMRLRQAEEMQQNLPEEQKEFGAAFCNILRSVKPVEPDILVNDGDVFDWCGGCKVVATPGHTPGHISLYLDRQRVVIAGDAAVIEGGKPVIANPQFTLDKKLAAVSLTKIMNLGATEMICFHGGSINL